MGYKNPEKQKLFQREWHAKRRAFLLQEKSCAICQGTDRLEILKRESTAKRATCALSTKRWTTITSTYLILCAAHAQEWRQSLFASLVRHGANQYRKSGCRCDVCVSGYRARRNAYYSRKKARLAMER